MYQTADFPESIRDYMIEKRRYLHAHPELSLREENTRDYIIAELNQLGISNQIVGTTGVLGELSGDRPGLTLLIRCELDALPLTEETGLEFASQNPGVMHACGHDGHMAILLGLIKYLVEQTVTFSGKLLFLFQPAEEIGAGARLVLEDFDRLGITLDEAISVHTGSELETGFITTYPGAVMSGTRTMKAMIRGKGGHASRPDATIDPINAMLIFLSMSQRLKDRMISPLEDAVLSFTGVHAGTKTNIVPETCEIWASMRFFKTEVGEKLRDILTRGAKATEEATGVIIEMVFSKGIPPVKNDPEVTKKCNAAALQTFGEKNTLHNERLMQSDDFGRILERWPGCYAFAGAGSDKIENHPGHSPKYDIDEGVFPYIVTYYLNYINNQN
ncbi:MAG: M20 family metallopeptidase [Clostridiaceae bacterium]